MQAQAPAMPTATETPFTQFHAQLSQALLACRVEPIPKAVHTLRTTTRRLEALLHKALEDHSRSKTLPKTIGKALRQLKKVRRLAGAVRDLDVHLKIVSKLFEKVTASDVERAALQHDQQQLHHHLAQKREQAAEVLASNLAKREFPLERAMERTASALAILRDPRADPLTTARRWVKRSGRQLRNLHPENLHDFRKQTKLARYLSEMQTNSPAGQAFALGLRNVQDAIGAWHDLELLHHEAKAVCGKHALLTQLLAIRTEGALKEALAAASSIHMS